MVDLATRLTGSANDALGIGVIVTDGVRVLDVNPSACRMLGRRPDEVRAMPSILALLAPSDRGRLGPDLIMPPDTAPTSTVARRTTLIRGDGTEIDVELSASTVSDGQDRRTVLLLRDLSEIKMLRHMAMTDPLTGLANRRVLLDRIDNVLFRARREPRHAVLFYIDLDGFKEVNDRHGHLAGDAVLVEIATRLLHDKRRYDLVARLGGDEFAVLVERIPDPAVLEAMAERLAEAFDEPHVIDGQPTPVGASIGWFAFTGDVPDADHVLRRADDAMYRCKHLRTV